MENLQETIQPPKYPLAIDAKLAGEGNKVFEKTCAGCHGTYGANGKYPNIIKKIIIPSDHISNAGAFNDGVSKNNSGAKYIYVPCRFVAEKLLLSFTI